MFKKFEQDIYETGLHIIVILIAYQLLYAMAKEKQ